jgi:hypothetical protein
MSRDADRLAAQFLGPDWRAVLDICRDDPNLTEPVWAAIAGSLMDWLKEAHRVDGRSGWPGIRDRVFAFDQLPDAGPTADLVFHACLQPNLMPSTLDEATLRWMIHGMPARTTSLISGEEQRSRAGSKLEKLQRAIDYYRGDAPYARPAIDDHWRFARMVTAGDVVTKTGGIGLGSPWSETAPDLVFDTLPGQFGVRLAQAEHKDGRVGNAAAELTISPPAPVSWRCLSDAPNDVHSYESVAGIGAFGAPVAFEVIDDEQPPELFDGRGSGLLVLDRGEPGTIVAFTVVPQDQECSTWVGNDEAGNATRLITDLGLLPLDPERAELPW